MASIHELEYERIARAIRFLAAHWLEHPDLDRAARAAGLSKYHFHRMFRRWAGISPARYLQLLTMSHGKQLLAGGRSLLDAALDLGLSGPSRLHDLFVTLEATTPGEFKSRGRDLRIAYGFHSSPFGTCLVATTTRGVCWLSFAEPGRKRDALGDLRAAWPEAEPVEAPAAGASIVRRIFAPAAERVGARAPQVARMPRGDVQGSRRRDAEGTPRDDPQPAPPAAGRSEPVRLHVRGTNFQVQVWKALLKLQAGGLVTYGDVAHAIGRPRAARAVGSAVGANPVAVLIPCHRVIRDAGGIGDYRWGAERKRALLAWESARVFGAVPRVAAGGTLRREAGA